MGKRCRQAGVQSGVKNREGVPSLVCFSSGGQVSKPIATAMVSSARSLYSGYPHPRLSLVTAETSM